MGAVAVTVAVKGVVSGSLPQPLPGLVSAGVGVGGLRGGEESGRCGFGMVRIPSLLAAALS